MRIEKTKTRNNDEIKLINNTAYNIKTPDNLILILETARLNKTRIHLFYGDIKTGKDWNEKFDIVGTIERSMGNIKIPLLLHNSRVIGGGSILTDCIVRIDYANKKHGGTLYQVKNYHK